MNCHPVETQLHSVSIRPSSAYRMNCFFCSSLPKVILEKMKATRHLGDKGKTFPSTRSKATRGQHTGLPSLSLSVATKSRKRSPPIWHDRHEPGLPNKDRKNQSLTAGAQSSCAGWELWARPPVLTPVPSQANHDSHGDVAHLELSVRCRNVQCQIFRPSGQYRPSYLASEGTARAASSPTKTSLVTYRCRYRRRALSLLLRPCLHE